MPKTERGGTRMECQERAARSDGLMPGTATGYAPFAWPTMTKH